MAIYLQHMLRNINPWVLNLIIAWSIVWKGWALWRAARLRHVGWYILLLILNLIGVPEIIYILVTNKKYRELNDRVR